MEILVALTIAAAVAVAWAILRGRSREAPPVAVPSAPGHRAPTRPPVPPAPAPAGPRGSWLVVVEGPDRGRSYLLGERSVTVGRATTNYIQLSDLEASRVHCLIRRTGERFQVVDMKSAGGTWLDAQRVETGTLEDGARLILGRTVLLFEADAVHPEDHTVARKGVETVFGRSTELPEGPEEGAGEGLGEDLAELGRLARQAREGTRREDLLRALALLLSSRGDWDRMAFLSEAPGSGWRVEAFHHRPRLELSRGRLPPDKALMARAAETGEDQVAPPSSADLGGLQGALALPVWRGDEVAGVLYVDRLSPRGGPPSPDAIGFVRAAADLTLDLPPESPGV